MNYGIINTGGKICTTQMVSGPNAKAVINGDSKAIIKENADEELENLENQFNDLISGLLECKSSLDGMVEATSKNNSDKEKMVKFEKILQFLNVVATTYSAMFP